MSAWEFARSPGFLSPCWDWFWANILAPGSFLVLGLGPRTHFKGQRCSLNRELCYKWFHDWFERAQMTLNKNLIQSVSMTSLPSWYICLYGSLHQLKTNIHLFGKHWNEYQKNMTCHCSRIPRRLTRCNLS